MDGLKIISEYYIVAPKIVKEIDSRVNSKEIYERIWDKYLKTFFDLIISDSNDDALLIYLRMVNELKFKYLTNNYTNK